MFCTFFFFFTFVQMSLFVFRPLVSSCLKTKTKDRSLTKGRGNQYRVLYVFQLGVCSSFLCLLTTQC